MSIVYTHLLLWPFTVDLLASYFCGKTVPVDTYCLKAKGLVKSFLRPEMGRQLRQSKTAISAWKFIECSRYICWMYEFYGSSSHLQVYRYHPKAGRYFESHLLEQHLLWHCMVRLWSVKKMRHTAPMVIKELISLMVRHEFVNTCTALKFMGYK